MRYWTPSRKLLLGLLLGGACVCLWGASAWFKTPLPPILPPVAAAPAITASMEPVQPLPAAPHLNEFEVRLGRELFHDPRLSADNTISCASCHNLQTGGMDRSPVSTGIRNQRGSRNAPTVFNVSLNYRQFWDGRAATLEEQASGPLQSPAEMAANWPETIARLRRDTHYVAAFDRLYKEGLQAGTIRSALATFERSLLTPGSRFDRYLQGERSAISATEQAGYRLFKSLGCVSCHQGRNVGGGMMQPFGVMQAPRLTTEKSSQKEDTPIEDTRLTLYKVPSLRNVARTAPYFHDGSISSLPAAVRIMSDAQLCRHLSDTEVQQIVAFLQTLTGAYEGRLL